MEFQWHVTQEGPKPAHLTWRNILIGLCFLLLDVFLSIYLKLGLATSLLTAAARCIIQLTVMVISFLMTSRGA